jgi:peroxiredoxin
MDAIALKDDQAQVRSGVSVKTILGIVVLAAFTILMTWRARVLETTLQSESAQSELVDMPAPDFSASTLDGRTVSLADFRGQKKVVVSFWASWCAPCRLEMPVLVKFYQRNHGGSGDFEILAISIDQDTKKAAEFAAAQKMNFTVLLDPTQKVANAYQVDGIPAMFVIDKNGKIIYGYIGYDDHMKDRLAGDLGIGAKKSAEEEP